MNTDPADIFEEDPRSHRPAPEEVRAVAEAADFRSRQPSVKPRRGKRRTGRTEQFACRITPAAAATIYPGLPRWIGPACPKAAETLAKPRTPCFTRRVRQDPPA
jgi:hypothetical protein